MKMCGAQGIGLTVAIAFIAVLAAGGAALLQMSSPYHTHFQVLHTVQLVPPSLSLTPALSLFCLSLSYLGLAPDQPFALLRHNTFIPQPAPHHVRYRGAEYTAAHDRFFFQWWNYLIIDPTTHHRYQLIYQIALHSTRANLSNPSYSVVAGKHQLPDHSSINAAHPHPLNQTSITNDMDLTIPSTTPTPLYTQTVLSPSTYRITGSFPSTTTSSSTPVSFHLTFHRIHGMYHSLDQEADNVRSCSLLSNYFAYSSEVEGWWNDDAGNVTFSRGSKVRGYAAASWGCQLPHTDSHSPVDFPWTWLWLTVPKTNTSPELSLALGTAKLEVPILGALNAGISVMGVGDDVIGTLRADAFHGSAYQLPLLSSASDGHLVWFTRNLSQWVNDSDNVGSWRLPLVQSYVITTAQWRVEVRVESERDEYFRAPVIVEDLHSGHLRLFSDFRACENRARVTLHRRAADGDEVVYDGLAGINAVEYAYEAELFGSVAATIAKLMPRSFQ